MIFKNTTENVISVIGLGDIAPGESTPDTDLPINVEGLEKVGGGSKGSGIDPKPVVEGPVGGNSRFLEGDE